MSSLIARQLAQPEQASGASTATGPSANYFGTAHSNLKTATYVWRTIAAVSALAAIGIALWCTNSVLSGRIQSINADALLGEALNENQRINGLSPAAKPAAIAGVCKTVGSAIAQLEYAYPEKAKQLRRVLIERLLQSQPQRFQEAERQILLLNASPDDRQVTKWLALALVGQVDTAIYQERDATRHEKEDHYWRWLASQPPGEVLFTALDHHPLDVRLVAHLVELAEHQRDMFLNKYPASPQVLKQRTLRQRVLERVAALRAVDGSHSLLVRHRFEMARDPIKAADILARGAAAAERRLLSLQSCPASHNGGDPSMSRLSVARPGHHWDFALLILVARNLCSTKPEVAQRYYRCLTGQQVTCFPSVAVANAYRQFGQLAVAQGQPVQALKIWESGIEQVGENSLELMGAIAALATEHETTMLANRGKQILDRYLQVIKFNAARVANAAPDEMTLAARKEAGRKIQAARWRASVLESHLLSRDHTKGDAIDCLRLALTQSADVQPAEEQRECLCLAEWYLAEGAADVAANYFERAHRLEPRNDQPRQRAADAWMVAGNRFRAAEQKRQLSSNATLMMKLEAVEAKFQRAIAERGGRQVVQSLLKDVASLTQEIQQQRAHSSFARDLRNVCSRLELMQACLPDNGAPLSDHFGTSGFQADIASIAREYRDQKRVQFFAAQYLAAAGAAAESDRAIQTLQHHDDTTATEMNVLRARVLAATGRPIAAAQFLLKEEKQTEVRSRTALVLAANLACLAKHYALAYDALNAVEASQRTSHDLFTLAKLAAKLPADSELFRHGNVTRDDVIRQWKTRLLKRERDSCGFYSSLQASSLLETLSARADVIAFDDPQLGQAKRIVRDLISRRPCWSETALLAAELSIIEGNSQQAIRVLRDAVMAGDETAHLRRRLDQLQVESQSVSNRWAQFASSRRSIGPSGRSANEPSIVQRLLDAHRSITDADVLVVSAPVSIFFQPNPTRF